MPDYMDEDDSRYYYTYNAEDVPDKDGSVHRPVGAADRRVNRKDARSDARSGALARGGRAQSSLSGRNQSLSQVQGGTGGEGGSTGPVNVVVRILNLFAPSNTNQFNPTVNASSTNTLHNNSSSTSSAEARSRSVQEQDSSVVDARDPRGNSGTAFASFVLGLTVACVAALLLGYSVSVLAPKDTTYTSPYTGASSSDSSSSAGPQAVPADGSGGAYTALQINTEAWPFRDEIPMCIWDKPYAVERGQCLSDYYSSAGFTFINSCAITGGLAIMDNTRYGFSCKDIDWRGYRDYVRK